MSKFIMMMGISGAGKSHLSIKLAVNLKAQIVSSDRIREELLGDVNDQTHNDTVFGEMFKRTVRDLESGMDVIYDATNLSMKRRVNLLRQLEDSVKKDFIKEIYVVMSSLDECVKRQYERTRRVPEEVLRRQLCQFQCPYYYEGWDIIHLVHNAPSVPLIWFLNQNMIPHENHHHTTVDIYEHMKQTRAHLLNNNDSYAISHSLLTATSYHDIGKYFTKSYKDNGEAIYYNHQNAGAYFFLLDEKYCATMGVKEALRAAVLIQFHMEFYTREEKGLERLRQLIGEDLWKDLEILHECDRAAH